MRVSSTRLCTSRLHLLPFVMAVAACSGEPANETEADLIERARGIHERVITLDTHNDINAAKCLAHNGHSHLRRSF